MPAIQLQVQGQKVNQSTIYSARIVLDEFKCSILGRIIKYSEPDINNMMIIGCLLCLLSIFVFGHDKSNHRGPVFNGFCQVREFNSSQFYIANIQILYYA